MRRWIVRIVLIAAVVFVVAFAGDSLVYRLRGGPTATVSVERYLQVPLKGNKQEFDDLGTIEVHCAVALFPQAGLNPCWQVRRHPDEYVKV